MPFTYASAPNPYVPTIAELMLRPGQIEAQKATAIGDAQSRAALAAGDAWGRAFSNTGAAAANTVQRMTDPRRTLDAIAVKDATQRQAGAETVDRLLTPYTPSGPMPEGETASAQHPFLDDRGLVDVPKLTSALSANGFGHLAPELVKGAESLNDSILKHQEYQQKAGQAEAILDGDVADHVLKLFKAGVPMDKALDFVASPAFAAKGTSPQHYVQLKQQLLALSPDQQQAALTSLMDQAAKLGGDKDLAKDVVRVDRYGRTVASNLVPEKPTEASLALDAANPNSPTRQQSADALAKLKPPRERTTEEQALDAYARSIGKVKAEDLTDADRQAYVARDAKRKAAEAFAQHVAEHTYDTAHPAPTKGKSQDELEQEARGVLQREFSSRSGGLGVEDQKVNQGIHLRALLDQYEGKNMPAQIQAELALGLARLTSPGGNVGAELEKEFNQRTAEGGISKAVAWLTGDPTLVNATPEKLREMFADSINRQGTVAEQNRQTYLNEMIAMLPTQLEKSRRDAIVASVKPTVMPAPKGAPADGTQRNGATWKHGTQGWGWYK